MKIDTLSVESNQDIIWIWTTIKSVIKREVWKEYEENRELKKTVEKLSFQCRTHDRSVQDLQRRIDSQSKYMKDVDVLLKQLEKDGIIKRMSDWESYCDEYWNGGWRHRERIEYNWKEYVDQWWSF